MDRVRLTQAFYQKRKKLSESLILSQNDSIAKKVGWRSYESQLSNFEIAVNIIGLDWSKVKNILDIGCGYGNLIEYLRTYKNYQGKYTGIDLIPSFIEDAEKLYGGDQRNNFIVGDFLTQGLENKFSYDIVFCLGALSVNYDQPDAYGKKSQQYAENLIALMSQLATCAIVLYFPNADNLSAKQRESFPDMAFYKSVEMETMLRDFNRKRLKTLDIQSDPTSNDLKTIVRVLLKT